MNYSGPSIPGTNALSQANRPTDKLQTLNDQITQLDPMLGTLDDFARRFGLMADRLFGAIPQEVKSAQSAAQPGDDTGTCLTMRLERRRLELQYCLNSLVVSLERLEGQI